MAKPTISVAEHIKAARVQIDEVETGAAIEMVQDGGTVFVDLREVKERKKNGQIQGSIALPRAFVEMAVDESHPFHRVELTGEKPVVFYCASGARSALAVKALQDMGYQASHLKEGFDAFAKAGGATEPIEG